MKKGKLIILMIGLVVSGLTSVNAQSKKEKIQMLTRKTDSLQRLLSFKNESVIVLQVKLSRLEGIKEAHNEEIQRLENKTDSLKELLIARNMTIESQTSKIAQLNTDLNGLQAQQKDWASKNEALAIELNSLKPKPVDVGTVPKETKVDVGTVPKETKTADIPKEEAKSGNVVSGNKPNPPIKN